ncbi:hypothetical protein Pcinc_037423 [Petrolisthes cinctipes]|uniref:DnaJ homolog subfamily C member 21 n=1 Tax=Petrolisthes cinctipes TaxID=88211 RepID=A0AAE1BWJ7_PETCI|nr:hypothetical protein Pcinc_037423 [Petrolisthes cinctipes]
MKCHYEILGVTLKANDDDLKKAYRKMALQWHPDKNPDKSEEAKEQFQLIQAAYEILSDPQERAFYDRNRESILRGKAANSEGNPENLDLFKYFTRQCYSGFNDSEKGFYTVYRQVFEDIAAKDMKYMDDEEDIIIPNFGSSDSDLEDVGQFYRYWSGYCTAMEFHWAETYDMREAHQMGRYVQRKAGRDNRKARQKARKEFNEEVRALVMFVRKRDKRWEARKKMLEEIALEKNQKQKERNRQMNEERENVMKHELEAAKADMAGYEKELELLERKFAEEWGLSEEEDNEGMEENGAQEEETGEDTEEKQNDEDLLSVLETLYCVACNKDFKTEKAMENHQRSKKHKENLEALKAVMTAEDAMLFQTDTIDQSIDDDNFPPVRNSSKKKKKKNKKNVVSEESQETAPPPDPSMTQKQKSFNVSTVETKDESEKGDQNKEDKSSSNADRLCNESTDTNTFNATELDIEENKKKVASEEDIDTANYNVEREEAAKPKTKGKKAKDARRKAQENNRVVETDVKTNLCTVCGKVYPSKNKLFSHIKAEGHASLKTASGKCPRGK